MSNNERWSMDVNLLTRNATKEKAQRKTTREVTGGNREAHDSLRGTGLGEATLHAL